MLQLFILYFLRFNNMEKNEDLLTIANELFEAMLIRSSYLCIHNLPKNDKVVICFECRRIEIKERKNEM